MPSIKVTPKKGLFQRGGTTTIPNGTLSGHKQVCLAKSSAYTLTQADCGSVVTVTGTTTITLPAASTSKGFHFLLFSGDTGTHTYESAGSSDISAYNAHSTADSGAYVTRAHAIDSIAVTGDIGNRVELWCNGTWWIATVISDAVATMS